MAPAALERPEARPHLYERSDMAKASRTYFVTSPQRVEHTPTAHCTIARVDGTFCDQPVPTDAPISACTAHLRQAWSYCQAVLDRAIDAQVPAARDFIPPLRNQRLMDRVRKARAVVYYALVDGHIKIGTTVNLASRMKALGANLIAVEPGTYDLERDRHAQFAALREPNSELFRPGPDLVAHVAALVERYTAKAA